MIAFRMPLLFSVFGVAVAALVSCFPGAEGVARFAHASESTAPGRTVTLANGKVARELTFDGFAWRTTRLARGDGSAELLLRSDEFHVRLFDDSEVTVEQYQAAGEPVRETVGDEKRIVIRYRPRGPLPKGAPREVVVTYRLRGEEPYLRKSVALAMSEGEAVDRLEVERFSTATPAAWGGRGQPVFLGKDWFVGLEYPGSWSRHTDGNTPAAYTEPNGRFGAYPSIVPLEGRDVEKKSSKGLVRLMHFPGYTRKGKEGAWGIVSKTAVAGVGKPGDSPELTFLDYLATIRRPVRSFLHYNNWYDARGKDLRVENFADRLCADFVKQLEPYGVKLDAMVPDNQCWHRADSLYEPARGPFPKGMDSLANLARSLEERGSGLGLWIALDGTAALDLKWGKAQGYVPCAGFNYPHFSLAQPRYRETLAERLRDLVTRGRLRYLKHDFNNLTSDGKECGHPATARHGHEACLDAQIELLALERECNPEIYQNVSNYTWFSPWWLMHCNNIWMLSDDSGELPGQPELSILVRAAAYRDAHLHRAWGRAETRPLVPVSFLMTHGIIFTASRYAAAGDTLEDFADHVMLYYMRGTQLKEWYINPALLKPDQWQALGRATRWSEEHLATLANAVMVGGDPAKGETHGYVCWNGDKGILGLRNPSFSEAEISVPFDQTVWYRGTRDRDFRAQVVYPWQEEWPSGFRSGQALKLKVPAKTVLVLHLEPGRPQAQARTPMPAAPECVGRLNEGRWQGRIRVPEEVSRCQVLLVSRQGPGGGLRVNGEVVAPERSARGAGWSLTAFNLLPWRGREARLEVNAGDSLFDREARLEGWLLLDRPVESAAASTDVRLPLPVRQGSRRQTLELFPTTTITTPSPGLSPADLARIKAAKVHIDTFGLETRIGGEGRILLGEGLALEVKSNRHGDAWESQVIDVPADKLGQIRMENTLRVARDNDRDRFKFRRLALAVQLPDDTWVVAHSGERAQTSHPDWAHKEGDVFESPTRSRPVTIRFPAKR